jgi:hypothetical protein
MPTVLSATNSTIQSNMRITVLAMRRITNGEPLRDLCSLCPSEIFN